MLRKISGIALVFVGLGIVLFSYGITAEAIIKMVVGGVALIAGVALVGSRELGEIIARFLKPQP